MYAKNLELLLNELCAKSDLSNHPFQDIGQRFTSLRGYGKLPRDRANRDAKLTTNEIVAAILGLVPSLPGWAGLAAIVLAKLRPVGGPQASFFEASSLEEAVSGILQDQVSRRSLIKVSMSVSEGGTNSHGYASIVHETHGARHRSFFVPEEAVSQLQEGAERAFDAETPYALISKDISFAQEFFERIAVAIETSEMLDQPLAGDGSEYDAEEALQKRYQKLGVRPGSRFLNVGVDNQVTWPREEMLIKFDRYSFVLMPKTRDHVQSIHIDLASNRLSDSEAMTLINRFLSVMTWCDDQFAIAQGGWSGNPVPVPVPKRNMAFTTTHNWILDRKIPDTDEKCRALGLYREALNAQHNALISYAVLNYYKVFELRYAKNSLARWIRDNLDHVTRRPNDPQMNRFLKECGTEPPELYIVRACRNAVAHARPSYKSDPDLADEIRRLHIAGLIMHRLARHFIKTELRISTHIFSGE